MKPMMIMLLVAAFTTTQAQEVNIAKTFADAEKQTKVMLDAIAEAQPMQPDGFSPRTLEKGALKLVPSKDWTSGFFPGVLWELYEYTHAAVWKEAATRFTAGMEKEKTNGHTHDMGFKIYCSVGTGYRLTKDAHYKEVIIQSARTLATRFNPVTGCIRSWDSNPQTAQWAYPVIIDNMMNLELLFEATKLSGDSSFYRIAVSHANTTLKNHFRSDYSSYHVVDYDTLHAGKVLQKSTHQGYASESAWARGQAWGLYGFTMCYRETHNPVYLQQAEHIATFILHNPHLPKDLVPYWDYNDPAIPNVPRDASAAAVMAAALYELSGYSENRLYYIAKADTMLQSLTGYYRSTIGENKGFLLLHSTGNKPANSEIDAPLSYADYYYLEALLRSKKVGR